MHHGQSSFETNKLNDQTAILCSSLFTVSLFRIARSHACSQCYLCNAAVFGAARAWGLTALDLTVQSNTDLHLPTWPAERF
jgi:hypothetical protein